MKSKLGYQIGVLIWTIVQFITFLFYNILFVNSMSSGSDTVVFLIIAGIIGYVVGSIIDMKIRKVHHGNVVFRFIVVTLVGPIRMFAQIFTLVQVNRLGKDNEIFAKGNYKPYFLNNLWYILFNYDNPKELISKGRKEKIEQARRENERRAAEREAAEAKRRAELEKLKTQIDSCNVKFVAFGEYDGGTKFWDAKFINRDMFGKGGWNKDTGVCYGAEPSSLKNSYGETMNAYFIKSIKVDGLKLNSKAFANHLSFNLRPGVHTVEVTAYFAHRHSGWEVNSNLPSDLWPSNTPKDKAGVTNKTFTLKVDIKPGYRYHLGLFLRNYASYTTYTDRRSGAYLYKLRNDIHFEDHFLVMGEQDVKKFANVGYIDPGLLIDHVN